jgi:hypothetical protein
MKPSASSILEYQSDQPSMKLLGPLSLLLPHNAEEKPNPSLFSCGVVPYQSFGPRVRIRLASWIEE